MSGARCAESAQEADEQTEHMGWVQPLTLPNGKQTRTFASPVRLSGQDSGRGTFSQRHSVLVDQSKESRYIPLRL